MRDLRRLARARPKPKGGRRPRCFFRWRTMGSPTWFRDGSALHVARAGARLSAHGQYGTIEGFDRASSASANRRQSKSRPLRSGFPKSPKTGSLENIERKRSRLLQVSALQRERIEEFVERLFDEESDALPGSARRRARRERRSAEGRRNPAGTGGAHHRRKLVRRRMRFHEGDDRRVAHAAAVPPHGCRNADRRRCPTCRAARC